MSQDETPPQNPRKKLNMFGQELGELFIDEIDKKLSYVSFGDETEVIGITSTIFGTGWKITLKNF